MKLITSLFALAAASSFAFAVDPAPAAPAAGEKPKRDPEASFKKMDANADGSLSLEEFTGKKKDATKAETQFKKRDKDGDGKLSLDELKAPGKKAS